MDNSAGWGSYALVNAYIWVLFGLMIGIGFFDNPWTTVMYAVWAMALNILVRKAMSATKQRNISNGTGLDDAGSLNDDDSLVDDFGGLDSDDVVTMANDDRV
tara:strand:+ start:313 stop:618 length:306 start_codon:yes stop_codon:yes gene_type:complete